MVDRELKILHDICPTEAMVPTVIFPKIIKSQLEEVSTSGR